ncbi:MAG: AAA family ATPase, partial [Actinomycetota bacterium]
HLLEIEGVVGILSNLLDVDTRFRPAVEALFGATSSVVVVRNADVAQRVLDIYDEGVAVLMPPDGSVILDPGASPLGDLDAVRNMFTCESVSVACVLAARSPTAIFLTADGAVVAGNLVLRGSAAVALKVEQEETNVAAAESRLQEINTEISTVQTRLDEANMRLNLADAAISAAAERLSSLDRDIHALRREADTVAASKVEVDRSIASFEAAAQLLTSEIPRLESEIASRSEDLERLQEEELRASVADASAGAELDEARVRNGIARERKRILEDRMVALAAALAHAVDSASGVQGVRQVLENAISRVASIQETAMILRSQAQSWSIEADEMFNHSREALQRFDSQVSDLRTDRVALVGALDDMRVRARQEDLGRSELKIRSRILEERMREEWAVDPDITVERFGHHWEVDDPSRIEELQGRIAAMDDEVIRRRHAKLERDLAEMGRVNPLAAQEFEALTAREEFLASQMADVRASRRDLFKIVASVDEQIKELFATAFEDVAREYERLFAMLFPGGQGRLRLTDPSDMLSTGVEVEARPGGKNLKRLSLLSGGERALSALAVLFAIFRARPSPFYVLDEVEAALDDVNLHRFLGLLKEFRQSSQLLVVSHQKRTMEIADVLYGVSIKPDGASRVISEKLAEFRAVNTSESISEDSL